MAARTRFGDSGSATLELVVWAPVLLLVIAVVILAGRVAQAHLTVEAAAAEAARAASAAETSAQARSEATAAAAAALGSRGLRCSSTAVTIDTSQWRTQAGTPATVSAAVSCDLALDDIAVPGVPGRMSIDASASSVLDTYRARP